MEQIFRIPRNPGGTEHAQTVCTRLFFSAHALEPGNEAIIIVEFTSGEGHA